MSLATWVANIDRVKVLLQGVLFTQEMELLLKEVPRCPIKEGLRFRVDDLEAARVRLLDNLAVFKERVPASSVLLTFHRLYHLDKAEGRVEEELDFYARYVMVKLRTSFHERKGNLWLAPNRHKPTACGHLVEHGSKLNCVEPVAVHDEPFLVFEQVLVDPRFG